MDRILYYKTDLNKFKMIQVIQNMFYDYSGNNQKLTTESSLENPQVFGNYATYF